MLFSFRHISWVAVISSLLGATLMFAIGLQTTINAVRAFLYDISVKTLSPADTATAYVIKSLDAFLIAFVLFIFAHGIYKLFINPEAPHSKTNTLGWIKITNIGHLKKILAEVIIIIIFVTFLELLLLNLNSLSWTLLILPVSILLLSVALKLLELDDPQK